MSSYATPADLTLYGVSPQALASTYSTLQQQTALDTAANFIDGYLASHYKLPLVTVSSDIKRACAILAAYDLMFSRGYNPDDGADILLKDRHDDVVSWLNKVADGKVSPNVQDSSTLAATDGGGGGAFTRQASVQYTQQGNSGLSLGGAPGTVADNQGQGFVVVGPPKLRGW